MFKKIRDWFSDSETIFWARWQMLTGAVVATLAVVDPMLFAPYISSHYVPIYIFLSGVITEFARRLRDPDL